MCLNQLWQIDAATDSSMSRSELHVPTLSVFEETADMKCLSSLNTQAYNVPFTLES